MACFRAFPFFDDPIKDFDLLSKANILSDLSGFKPNPQNLSTAFFLSHVLHAFYHKVISLSAPRTVGP